MPPDAIDQDAMRVKEDPDAKGGGAEAEAARRSDPRELEPEEGDRDDKPSRHDASAKEDVDGGGEKNIKEEKVEGAADAAVKAELGDAADANDPGPAPEAETGARGGCERRGRRGRRRGGTGDHGQRPRRSVRCRGDRRERRVSD